MDGASRPKTQMKSFKKMLRELLGLAGKIAAFFLVLLWVIGIISIVFG